MRQKGETIGQQPHPPPFTLNISTLLSFFRLSLRRENKRNFLYLSRLDHRVKAVIMFSKLNRFASVREMRLNWGNRGNDSIPTLARHMITAPIFSVHFPVIRKRGSGAP